MLVGGAQPADAALRFLGGALGVEVHQPPQEFVFGFTVRGGLVGQRRGGAGLAAQRLGEVGPADGSEWRPSALSAVALDLVACHIRQRAYNNSSDSFQAVTD